MDIDQANGFGEFEVINFNGRSAELENFASASGIPSKRDRPGGLFRPGLNDFKPPYTPPAPTTGGEATGKDVTDRKSVNERPGALHEQSDEAKATGKPSMRPTGTTNTGSAGSTGVAPVLDAQGNPIADIGVSNIPLILGSIGGVVLLVLVLSMRKKPAPILVSGAPRPAAPAAIK